MQYPNMLLSNNLRLFRLKAGYTQRDASQLLGVTLTSYQRWELGLAWPKPDYLGALSDLYQKKIHEFFIDTLAKKPLRNRVDSQWDASGRKRPSRGR